MRACVLARVMFASLFGLFVFFVVNILDKYKICNSRIIHSISFRIIRYLEM